MYVTRGMDGSHPECLQMRTGGERYHASCIRTHLHYLFSCFCLMVSCFICRNLTLPSLKKGVFVRNGCFSPMRSISVVMKWALFYFKLFFRAKVSQNNFNFNQIEARRFILEVMLYRYLQTLFYTIVIVVVTVT